MRNPRIRALPRSRLHGPKGTMEHSAAVRDSRRAVSGSPARWLCQFVTVARWCWRGSEGAEQRDELADLVGGREVRRAVAEGAAVREFHPRY